jgi:oligoendopeptidase F
MTKKITWTLLEQWIPSASLGGSVMGVDKYGALRVELRANGWYRLSRRSKQGDNMTPQLVQGPSWRLSDVYTSLSDPQLVSDLDRARTVLDSVESLNGQLLDTPEVTIAQALFRSLEEASILLATVSVYGRCLISVDGQDDEALKLLGSMENDLKRVSVLAVPLSQFLDAANETTIEAYLADKDVGASRFQVEHARGRRHTRLSLPQEALVKRLAQDGVNAWGKLYSQLSGTVRCSVELADDVRTLGLAEAAALMSSADDAVRRAAWQGINEGWRAHEESCAAILNALAGGRLEMCDERSHNGPVGFLDEALHASRISQETLEALMFVARQARPIGQRAAKLQARAYGKTGFGAWDLRAPAPVLGDAGTRAAIPFEMAMEQVANAYGEVDGSMADFVRMMGAKGWIEGSVGPNKRPGAYCTGFRKSREPLVYMTYSGGASNVITLAHELGHAYHSWVMRDLPMSQTSYGMSLAETASTFGETLVRDALLRHSKSPQDRLDMLWAEMSAFTGFTLNIPTRFEFESRFYEARKERPLRPAELSTMMSESWKAWYGDALAEPDPMFWASKLHFSMSYMSFYNFPYLFGYLFSLGVYDKRAAFGETFFPRYVALLRDTGRMSAEVLALKHLNEDITEPSFWMSIIKRLELRVDAFESLLDEVGL